MHGGLTAKSTNFNINNIVNGFLLAQKLFSRVSLFLLGMRRVSPFWRQIFAFDMHYSIHIGEVIILTI